MKKLNGNKRRLGAIIMGCALIVLSVLLLCACEEDKLPGTIYIHTFLPEMEEPTVVIIDAQKNARINTFYVDCYHLTDYESTPESQRKGYRFEGWYKNDKYTQKIEKIGEEQFNSDDHIYAKWTLIGSAVEDYKITIKSGEGVFSDGSTEKTIWVKWDEKYGCGYLGLDNLAVIPDPLPPVDGVDQPFEGYERSETHTNTKKILYDAKKLRAVSYDSKGKELKKTSLIAVINDETWDAQYIKPYDVEYSDDGVSLRTVKASRGCRFEFATYDEDMERKNTNSRIGYEFDGWQINDVKYKAGVIIEPFNITPNLGQTTIKVVAKWKPKVYTLSVDFEESKRRAGVNPDSKMSVGGCTEKYGFEIEFGARIELERPRLYQYDFRRWWLIWIDSSNTMRYTPLTNQYGLMEHKFTFEGVSHFTSYTYDLVFDYYDDNLSYKGEKEILGSDWERCCSTGRLVAQFEKKTNIEFAYEWAIANNNADPRNLEETDLDHFTSSKTTIIKSETDNVITTAFESWETLKKDVRDNRPVGFIFCGYYIKTGDSDFESIGMNPTDALPMKAGESMELIVVWKCCGHDFGFSVTDSICPLCQMERGQKEDSDLDGVFESHCSAVWQGDSQEDPSDSPQNSIAYPKDLIGYRKEQIRNGKEL